MKTIKFRAWDKENKKMFYPTKLFFIDGWLTCIHNNEPRECNPEKERIDETYYEECREANFNAILMQFTGLKDRNTVDAFDGDIVRTHIGMGIDVGGIGVIEWNNDFGGWVVNTGTKYPDHFGSEIDSFEVIGNKFGNPELLKESNAKQ